MTAKLIARLRAPERAGAASPLLRFIAGDFADAVAHVWPAPHAEFFALPAARRHAAAIGLAGLGATAPGPRDLRRMVEFARDADVAAAIAGPLAPGLMRALAKGGETLWGVEDYHAFIGLLADPMANEVLRHMEEVRPAKFGPMALLPPALRVAPVVRVLTGVAAASDLALAFRLAVGVRGVEAGPRIARRWAAGGEARAVFNRAMEDLVPDAFRPADPAPRLADPFVRIVSRKQLEQVALEFRNCLADHAVRIAEGRMAVFVWRGEVSAAIALNWDVAGWRLSEAKAADNVDLDEVRLRELVGVLAAHGVRTGPSVQTLTSRLDDHANGTAYCNHPGPGFVEQLALGDLWS
jgi:hypothetical protein